MTSLLATLGHSGVVAAGLVGSGGLGVALPCASAKRSRLLPGSHQGIERDRCCLEFLGDWRYWSFWVMSKSGSTPSCPQDWHHLHFTVSTVISLTSDHQVFLSLAALQRLLASRVLGGYSLTSDEPALGSVTVSGCL